MNVRNDDGVCYGCNLESGQNWSCLCWNLHFTISTCLMSKIFSSQNLICFLLLTPELRFRCMNIPFLLTSSQDMKS